MPKIDARAIWDRCLPPSWTQPWFWRDLTYQALTIFGWIRFLKIKNKSNSETAYEIVRHHNALIRGEFIRLVVAVVHIFSTIIFNLRSTLNFKENTRYNNAVYSYCTRTHILYTGICAYISLFIYMCVCVLLTTHYYNILGFGIKCVIIAHTYIFSFFTSVDLAQWVGRGCSKIAVYSLVDGVVVAVVAEDPISTSLNGWNIVSAERINYFIHTNSHLSILQPTLPSRRRIHCAEEPRRFPFYITMKCATITTADMGKRVEIAVAR